jgi:hypothetical protein
MLAAGEIDAIISPRAPSCHASGDGNVGWLFDDPTAAAIDYYRRTRVFPIMHMVGVRRSLADRHPWLAAAVSPDELLGQAEHDFRSCLRCHGLFLPNRPFKKGTGSK